jgi:hypothetical protein
LGLQEEEKTSFMQQRSFVTQRRGHWSLGKAQPTAPNPVHSKATAETHRRKHEGETVYAYVPPLRSKVVLLVIEMVPLAGPLGIDRFYLGSIWSGVAKLLLCLLTNMFGGVVWYMVDAILVTVNALQHKEDIHVLGMEARFSEDEIGTAYILGCILIPVQLLHCCGGGIMLKAFVEALGKRWTSSQLLSFRTPGSGPLRSGSDTLSPAMPLQQEQHAPAEVLAPPGATEHPLPAPEAA